MTFPSRNILLLVFLTHIAIDLDALSFHIPSRRGRQAITKQRYRRLDVQDEQSRRRVGVQVPPLLDLSSTAPSYTRPAVSLPNDFRAPLVHQRRAFARQQIVSDVHELRRMVLDERVPLRNLKVELNVANTTTSELVSHEVVQLIAERFRTQSKPGARHPDDTAKLALSLEGGGMRGAVSAGMAAAIASLGLTDTFDTIYGSSAGSVIGAYMVSRQMCMDVYVDILPAAKRAFVCTKRMFSALALTALDWALSLGPVDLPKLALNALPGMNISFVLDGIMDHADGIRPLDLERFRANDQKQPLRIASSYVKDGKLYTKCFGTRNFFPDHPESAKRGDGRREGIYACLEASMTVPGATGPPVPIVNSSGNETVNFFDAFCFEPLPYRSAVEEGATHVLVLCSRPEGFQPKTAPGVYERGIAPIYFRSHGEPEVAEFFEQGGQQYIYAEDLLTLEEGKRAGVKPGKRDGVHVPPPNILYGVKRDDESAQKIASDRNKWKKAHLLPLKVPIGTPELATLEQEREEVSHAVRGGFAAAFDLLAPAIGLKLDENLTGAGVAEFIFPPGKELDLGVLQHQLRVTGDSISSSNPPTPPIRRRRRDIVLRVLGLRRRRKNAAAKISAQAVAEQRITESMNPSENLLSVLPGFACGKMAHLASGLRSEITR